MSTGELADRLLALSDEIAELALDRLREAADSLGPDGTPDQALLAEERRLTRARRAVEKAAQLLGGATPDSDD